MAADLQLQGWGLATGLGLDVSFQTSSHSGVSSVALVTQLVQAINICNSILCEMGMVPGDAVAPSTRTDDEKDPAGQRPE